MAKVPFLAWVFQGIPESICLVYLSCKFLQFNIQRKYNKVIIFGILQALFAYIIRLFPFTFGVHSVFLCITLTLWTFLITKKDLIFSLISSSIAFFLLCFYEIISFKVLVDIFNLNIQLVLNNIWLRIIVGWPQIFLLILTAVFIELLEKKIKKKINM